MKESIVKQLVDNPVKISVEETNPDEYTMEIKMKKSWQYYQSIIFALLISFSLIKTITAQSKAEQLKEFFDYYNVNGMFNGAVLAAVDGNIIFQKAYGFSDFENKIPLDTSSVFAIASLGKPYTATAIMMLEERGKLSYDDILSKYFPEFPEYSEQISIKHLLTHTSGIIDYLSRGLNLQQQFPIITKRIIIDSLSNQPKLLFKSGEKYGYSNSNYALLAFIIEKVSGQSYREFLQANLFNPLGMNHTYVRDEVFTSIPNKVNGYDAYWEKNEDDLQHLEGTRIYSTVHDQFLFDQALYTEELVTQKTLQQAFDTTGLLDRRKYVYGYGWKIPINIEGNIVFHNGAVGGFCSELWRSIDKKETLIILSNDTWIRFAPDIISGAENIMQGLPYELGRKSAAVLFFESWYMNGFQAAMGKLKKAMNMTPPEYYLEPWEIHFLGQSLFLDKEYIEEAIEVFEFSTEMFPQGPVLWSTLGEAYIKYSQKDLAIQCYEKVLELNPKSKNARRMLDKLKN
jgi:CubicO group peptidase (beta-lactamase class C family)